MELEQEAAQEQESNFVFDSDDQATEQEDNLDQPTESAPVEEEDESEVAKEPTDSFQSRINKVTADKYAEKRRADELQKKIDELQSKSKPEEAKPTLESFDYDEDQYNQANISYQVQQELKKQNELQKQQTTQQQEQQKATEFNERIAKFGKDDFAEKANSVPNLPSGVADALVNSDNGPALIYHLAEHLDVADSISNMSPSQAMMELGRISANLSVKKSIKPSAAPEPIKTLKSGGVISKDRGPSGATYS